MAARRTGAVSSIAIQETQKPGYTVTGVDCRKNNVTVAGVPIAETFTLSGLASTDIATCIVRNRRLTGKLEVVKKLAGGGSDRFNLSATGPAGSTALSASNVGDNGTTGAGGTTVPTGTWTPGESAVSPADLANYDRSLLCFKRGDASKTNLAGGTTVGSTVSISDTGNNADVVCEITNTRKATIQVVKDFTGQFDPADRVTLSTQPASGSVVTTTNVADNGSTSPRTLPGGTVVTFGEAFTTGSASNYASSAACVDTKGTVGTGDDTAVSLSAPFTALSGGVTLPAGATVVCTITNARLTGKLEVVKKLLGGGSDLFNLSATGPAGSTALSASGVGNNGTTGAGGTTVATGTWTPGESAAGATNLGTYDKAVKCYARADANKTNIATGATLGSTVSVASGADVVCEITNTKDATVQVVKDAQPDGAQDFAFTTSGLGAGFSLDDDSDATLSNTNSITVTAGGLGFGSKSIAETPTSGWTLTSTSCQNGTQAPQSNATINVQPGDAWVCTFTNRKAAKLTVKKVTDPVSAAQDFAFTATGSGTSGFSLDTDSDATLSDTEVFTFDGNQLGSKSVTETATSGWSLTGVSCTKTNSGSGATATVDIQAGDDVTCTFTNKQDATVQVVKDAQPDGAQDFAFTTSGLGAGFSLDDDSDATLSNTNSITVTAGGLGFGSKSIAETPTSGWTLTSTSCQNGTQAPQSNATINVQPGDAWVCTFTNKQDATLTIVKDAQPDSAQDFAFTTTGSGTSDFSLDDDADGTLNNTKTFTFDGNQLGAKSVTETDAAGWTLTDLSCTETNSGTGSTATVDLQAGDDVTCTFTNRKAAKLTVKKVTDPVSAAQDFAFTATGSGTSGFSLDTDSDATLSDTEVFTFDGNQLGSKSVTETATSGWSLTGVSCTKTNSGSGATATVDIQAGDDVTCTFTNKQDATVQVVKDAQPDGAQDFAFTTSGLGAGFSLDDDSDATLSNTNSITVTAGGLGFGSKSIAETPTSGWTLTSTSCQNGTQAPQSNATINVQPGDAWVCTFTNKQDATLTIVKDAQPDSAQDFAFTTTGSGTSDFSLDDDADAHTRQHQDLHLRGDRVRHEARDRGLEHRLGPERDLVSDGRRGVRRHRRRAVRGRCQRHRLRPGRRHDPRQRHGRRRHHLPLHEQAGGRQDRQDG